MTESAAEGVERAPLRLATRPGEPEVIVIGGGFAGLAAARALARDRSIHVTLVDRRNHHLFQPLLYQVATAGLNPADIAVPIRSQFSGLENVAVHLGEVDTIDLAAKWIGGGGVRLSYDYLIIASGTQHSYFGNPEWEPFAPGLKTLEQATEIRRRILSAFEAAENALDEEHERSLLTFVVIGGGPTGVELAGAIADISRTVLLKDFRRIDPASARVLLVEAGPRLLAAFPETLATSATRALTKLGVDVLVASRVEQVDADGVIVAGARIAAKSVFWAAGVQASKLGQATGVPLDRHGRIVVERDLSIPGHPDAFAVGDVAHVTLGDGQIAPGLAPAALQMGRLAAKNVKASIGGRPRQAFRYVDKGMMATIGKHQAIALTGKLALTGYLAWLAWLFVHILYLVGFKNRVAVFLQWAWTYTFSKRGARLITSPRWQLER